MLDYETPTSRDILHTGAPQNIELLRCGMSRRRRVVFRGCSLWKYFDSALWYRPLMHRTTGTFLATTKVDSEKPEELQMLKMRRTIASEIGRDGRERDQRAEIATAVRLHLLHHH